jgi:phosphatidylglycerophosphate synthase
MAERRPIASRELAVSRRLARWMARRGWSPNAISTCGMLAAIAGGGCLYATGHLDEPYLRIAWIAAAALAQMRLLANMFDGMVAIESDRASPIGELFNEVPDRVSDSALLIGLGYARGGHILLGFTAALLAVFTAYVRAMGKVAGGRQEFCGPMAKPQRMLVVTATALWCGLAPAALQVESVGFGLPSYALVIIAVGCVITAARRLWRISRSLSRGEP